MGAIELRGVAVVHDDREVLRDVDLVVPAGEVVALLGRSGTGKTTLLRAVAGLHPLATGTVLLDGRDVSHLPSRDRGLGMVAQGAPLHPTRDVEGNLRLPLDLRGDDRHEARERARGEGFRFGLRRLLRRRPDQLSTGERASVAVARSVVRGPSALLLDEPATHLDPQTRARVLQQVGIVQRTRGTTILLATNDLGVAAALAGRVAVLDRGTIGQVGTLEQLRAAPVTLDVADLVLPAPLARLTGRVVADGRGLPTRVTTAAGDVPTWDRRVRTHAGPVVVALPQHDLSLVPPGTGQLSGTVTRVATTGAHRLVTVGTAAGPVVVSVDAGRAGVDHPVAAPGDAVDMEVRRALVATLDGLVLADLSRR